MNSEVWDSETMGLDTLVTGLLFLLYNPNFDDPLWIPDGGWNAEEFAQDVSKAMQGEEVHGYTFIQKLWPRKDKPVLPSVLGQVLPSSKLY